MKEIIIKGKFKAVWVDLLELYNISLYDKVGVTIGAYNEKNKGFWFDADAVCVDEFQEFLRFIDSENLSINQKKIENETL